MAQPEQQATGAPAAAGNTSMSRYGSSAGELSSPPPNSLSEQPSPPPMPIHTGNGPPRRNTAARKPRKPRDPNAPVIQHKRKIAGAIDTDQDVPVDSKSLALAAAAAAAAASASHQPRISDISDMTAPSPP
ncbi:hypothetical protein LRP88_11523 [Fusarium phalaenopsidis]